jgi:hypothetical protein
MRDTAVGVVTSTLITGWMTEELGFHSRRDKTLSRFQSIEMWLWGPPDLLPHGYRRIFSLVVKCSLLKPD